MTPKASWWKPAGSDPVPIGEAAQAPTRQLRRDARLPRQNNGMAVTSWGARAAGRQDMLPALLVRRGDSAVTQRPHSLLRRDAALASRGRLALVPHRRISSHHWARSTACAPLASPSTRGFEEVAATSLTTWAPGTGGASSGSGPRLPVELSNTSRYDAGDASEGGGETSISSPCESSAQRSCLDLPWKARPG